MSEKCPYGDDDIADIKCTSESDNEVVWDEFEECCDEGVL